MPSPLATVAFVPREVFSTTQRSLERLLSVTAKPYELVVIDGGSPPDIAKYLAAQSRQHGFTLLRTEQILTPNQARNLAAAQVRTKYVVFVDNDVLPAAGWLEALVTCAEDTGAWVVGPKYFEHEPEGVKLHMYGGECRIDLDQRGRRTYVERHHLAHKLEAEVPETLERRETELIEFHTALVAMEAFRTLGPLDEKFLSNAEHGDLCLAVRAAGHTVYLEPKSEITYIPPRELTEADRAFFNLRWSQVWQQATLQRMNEKYGLDPRAVHNRNSRSWISGHRRYALDWLWKLKKQVGAGPARKLEKWLIGPIENRVNQWRYPRAKYGAPTAPTVRVVNRAA